ncbi:MAG: hypothetical protein B6I34_06830 [Anaerolineaceae bacterium 4572_32.1]|nr:MAG: hypothetical protein B6I34_06830 [Anaerolineaceae bacterium 4572_32.1]
MDDLFRRFVMLLIVLTRSSALAMLGGLLIFGGDFIVTALEMGEFGLKAYSILGNTLVLFSKTVGEVKIVNLAAGEFNEPGPAFLILILYAIIGVALAHFIFQKQDLAGKK